MAYDKSIVITRELNRRDRLQDLDEHLDEDLDDVETIFLPHVITTSSLYLSHTDYSLFCFLFYLFYKLQSFALSDLSYFSCVFFKSMFSVTWIQIWGGFGVPSVTRCGNDFKVFGHFFEGIFSTCQNFQLTNGIFYYMLTFSLLLMAKYWSVNLVNRLM